MFTDTDPQAYIKDVKNVNYIHTKHANWVDGTNSKYNNILSLETQKLDYIYYFDADTNINKNFTEEWFLGDLVGGQHYGDLDFMLKDGRPYDRNPKSKAYVPEDTRLPQMYYYGAFWGGTKINVINMCKILSNNQLEDKQIPYEPRWNDESYVNNYFHYNPPTFVVLSKNFAFDVSDKGGLGDTRYVNNDINDLKNTILLRSLNLFDIKHGKMV
jgi:hypothetical protein